MASHNWTKNVQFLVLGYHVATHKWSINALISNKLSHDDKKLNKTFVVYILKIKPHWLNAFFMIIIQFNITKFKNHDYIIF